MLELEKYTMKVELQFHLEKPSLSFRSSSKSENEYAKLPLLNFVPRECKVILEDIKFDKTIKLIKNRAILKDSDKKDRDKKKYSAAPSPAPETELKLSEISSTEVTSLENPDECNRIPSSNIVPKNYCCIVCNVGFTDQVEVKLHPHTQNVCKYLCKICNRHFNTRGAFVVHIIQHDIKKSLYKCQTCSKTFTDKLQLESHYVIEHFRKPTDKNQHVNKEDEAVIIIDIDNLNSLENNMTNKPSINPRFLESRDTLNQITSINTNKYKRSIISKQDVIARKPGLVVPLAPKALLPLPQSAKLVNSDSKFEATANITKSLNSPTTKSGSSSKLVSAIPAQLKEIPVLDKNKRPSLKTNESPQLASSSLLGSTVNSTNSFNRHSLSYQFPIEPTNTVYETPQMNYIMINPQSEACNLPKNVSDQSGYYLYVPSAQGSTNVAAVPCPGYASTQLGTGVSGQNQLIFTQPFNSGSVVLNSQQPAGSYMVNVEESTGSINMSESTSNSVLPNVVLNTNLNYSQRHASAEPSGSQLMYFIIPNTSESLPTTSGSQVSALTPIATNPLPETPGVIERSDLNKSAEKSYKKTDPLSIYANEFAKFLQRKPIKFASSVPENDDLVIVEENSTDKSKQSESSNVNSSSTPKIFVKKLSDLTTTPMLKRCDSCHGSGQNGKSISYCSSVTKCRYCDYHSCSLLFLKSHYMQEHKMHYCVRCNYLCKKESLFASHRLDLHTCKQCMKVLTDENNQPCSCPKF